MYIVPAGSTYQLKSFTGAVLIDTWREARMPLAIATGGKTVAFRGNFSANQTGLTSLEWTKVELDTASVDTDNALVDGKFKPSVAGYYQVNGSIEQTCSPTSTNTVSSIYKNGSMVSRSSNSTTTSSLSANVSDVIYLNGTTDYLELWGRVVSTGTCSIQSLSTVTFLSAVLVSGGSASGDSIWTEEDGSVLYSAEDRARILLSETNSDRGVGVGSWNNKKYLESTGDGDFIISHNSDSDRLVFKIGGGPKSKEAMTIGDNNITMAVTETAGVPNMHINATSGRIFRSTTVMYSAEEVDKKLAIKDKLIEKLSDRLDKLEKKLKKTK